MNITQNSPPFIHEKIKELTKRIKRLDAEKVTLTEEIQQLQALLEKQQQEKEIPPASCSSTEKLAIFMNLFRGREDVFRKRWENKKTGKSDFILYRIFLLDFCEPCESWRRHRGSNQSNHSCPQEAFSK